jgi:hypothetical protein
MDWLMQQGYRESKDAGCIKLVGILCGNSEESGKMQVFSSDFRGKGY